MGDWDNYKPIGSENGNVRERGKGCKGSGKGRPIHLQKIEWGGMQLDRVCKTFLHEAPEVALRTQDECDRWRMENAVKVSENGTFDDHPYDVPKPVLSWAEVSFPDFIVNALRGTSSFDAPFPIQSQVWPAALDGRDIVGIAETGSGKTLAYVLPMLVHVVAQKEVRLGEGPIGLVFVPTRELSIQIQEHISRITRYADHRLKSVAIYGGPHNREDQVRELAKGDAEIVIATPGRLIDLLNDGKTNLLRATFLIVDEADELLKQEEKQQGLSDQIELILTQSRPDKQVLLFSATWPDKVEELATKVCGKENPLLYVAQGPTKLSACKNIVQRFHQVKEDNIPAALETRPRHYPPELSVAKLYQLNKVIRTAQPDKMISDGKRLLVFCNKKDDVERVTNFLKRECLPADGMLSRLPQERRDEILCKFRAPENTTPILVCTDLLGRGLDFPDVHYVVNFDMPRRVVNYIHRIGRTARAGKMGYSMTFIDQDFFDWRRTPEDLKTVLETSQQVVPIWLSKGNVDARRQRRREEREKWQYQALDEQDPKNPQDSTDTAVAPEWQGRGSGRVYQELLAQSATANIHQESNSELTPENLENLQRSFQESSASASQPPEAVWRPQW